MHIKTNKLKHHLQTLCLILMYLLMIQNFEMNLPIIKKNDRIKLWHDPNILKDLYALVLIEALLKISKAAL